MSEAAPLPDELWANLHPQVQAFILALIEQNRILQERVAHLEAQLQTNSTNSSKPPSSDPPSVKRSPPKPPSRKRQGGQPGHPRHERVILPPEKVNHFHECIPVRCAHCEFSLQGTDPQPVRHQVTELPPIEPIISEYRLHRLTCENCGCSTEGTLPQGVQGHFGPRVHACVALLSGAYRLAVRPVQQLMHDILGVDISTGMIAKSRALTGSICEPIITELHNYARTQPANVDETSLRQKNDRHWLWVMVTSFATLFFHCPTRSAREVRMILGEDRGAIITSDRFKSYDFLSIVRRQICWAHVRRDFQAMIDRKNAGSEIGKELMELSDNVFDHWHMVRDGTMSRRAFQLRVRRWRRELRVILSRGKGCVCAKTSGCCRELRKVQSGLWTFAEHEGIEPTNNAAEQALRHAVQWRKTSYGTMSESGSRFVERVLSIVATCRQQERNVWEFLTKCWTSHLRNQQRPSLLPSVQN